MADLRCDGPVLKMYAEIGGDGGCLLYIFDPPGLLARGNTVDEALAAAPAEAARLRLFLAECGRLDLLGQTWDEGRAPRFDIAEKVERRGVVANGRTVATFRRDLDPVRPEEVGGFIDVMRHMRATVLALRERISPAAYTFKSAPHRGTIDEQLRHIASCERWYLGHLWPVMPRLPRSDDAWHKLALNREAAYNLLGNMSPEEMARVTKVGGETWTPRKVFRRFLYHEKFHRDAIERDLASAPVSADVAGYRG
jgi:hypothetical protein